MSNVIPFNYQAKIDRDLRASLNDRYDLNMVEFDEFEERALAVVISLFNDANDNEPTPEA